MYTDEKCCLCGSTSNVKFCDLCGHAFCQRCRHAYFYRGLEALKQFLGRSNLRCGGQHG